MAVGKNGTNVYIGIIPGAGGVDVIEAPTRQRIRTSPPRAHPQRLHDPRRRHAVAGSIAGKTINVIDAQTNETAWTMDMDLGVGQ